MSRQARPSERDHWVVLLERSAPVIVGALLAGMAVLWLLAGILGASWARF